MTKEKMGKVCCAECEKVIAYFPVEAQPTEELELYCEDCIEKEGNE